MLSTPTLARIPLHSRQVHFQGFERADGLFDIEATLLDTKAAAFEVEGEGRWEPGQPIHGMSLRICIDRDFVVRDIESSMDAFPHGECLGARDPMRQMIGCSVRKGWRQAIEERLGRIQGCAHLRELLFNMGTVAFQSLAVHMHAANRASGKAPAPMGGCLAWDPAGPMVERIYPQFYIRPEKA